MLKSVPILLLLGLGFSLLGFLPTSPLSLRYHIEEQSQLYLEGTSNVVDFKCDCDQQFGEGELIMRAESNGQLQFSGAQLRLPVRMLDCGNRGMNKDMYETLQAHEYPYIKIDLKQVTAHGSHSLLNPDEWYRYSAIIELEIANTKRRVEMPVRALKLGDNRFRFQGDQSIMLTDFQIEPPRAMMGLVRVDDCINIHADLILSLP